jgi:helicase
VDGLYVPEGVNMRVQDLEIYGFPRIMIQRWKENMGENLLPLQEAAVREHNLLGQGNLIISAPTSSGKTFCGEMAMAKALINGSKAVCLVPLKALAEERYRDFSAKYGPLGLKVIISTADRREFDRSFQTGDYNLAIIIFEKFNQLLTRDLDLLANIDLILIDELQMICDSSRGAVLELTLLKIRHSKFQCRLIGLSAVLARAERLAEWLGADLFVSDYRPLDLYQGILWEGRYHYREFNSGKQNVVRILDDDSLPADEQLLEAIRKLIEQDDERILVFLKSKFSCEQFAAALAERLKLPRADRTIEGLSGIPRTCLTDRLLEILENGIAFHHADLSHGQREAVEEGYKRGEIRALFATTTLALGLNLPANTVFLEPFKFRSGCYSRKAIAQHLEWSEYENMCGRAGRLNQVSEAGKAIILVNSEFEKEVIWSKFIEGRTPDLTGQLNGSECNDLVLDLICSGCCANLTDLKSALAESFSGYEKSDFEIENAIGMCAEKKWIESRNKDLKATALGKAISGYGISCLSAERILTLLSDITGIGEIFWIYEFVDLPEMTQRSSLGFGSYHEFDLFERLKRITADNESGRFRLCRVLAEPELLDHTNLAKMALTLALAEWCRGESLEEIENKYHLHAGILLNAAGIAAWLSESAFALARVLRMPRRFYQIFRRLSFALEHGIEFKLRNLWKISRAILDREEVYRLCRAGIRNLHDFAAADKQRLDLLIGPVKTDQIMKNIEKDRVNPISKERNMRDYKLILEGRSQRDRLTVKYFGRELPLTLKSFKYLAKLACARIRDNLGWLHKEDLEPGFNQARYIYNLKKELGLGKDQAVLENNREGYYRLNIMPEDIVLNSENLRSIQDYELKCLAEQLGS